jgi:hypothetical protein
VDEPSVIPLPLESIPFDTREERVVAGLARWMGLLGRFQIVSATALVVMLLVTVAIVTSAEFFEPEVEEGLAPITLGEAIDGQTLLGGLIALGAFCFVFLRGGALLIAAAEDLEHLLATDDLDQHHLESALRRLRAYFVLECLLVGFGMVAAGILATVGVL